MCYKRRSTERANLYIRIQSKYYNLNSRVLHIQLTRTWCNGSILGLGPRGTVRIRRFRLRVMAVLWGAEGCNTLNRTCSNQAVLSCKTPQILCVRCSWLHTSLPNWRGGIVTRYALVNLRSLIGLKAVGLYPIRCEFESRRRYAYPRNLNE